jgi:hypothetical protein
MTTRQSQRRRWKKAESKIAERLDGKRIPLLGREGSDLDTPVFFVEVKSRQEIGQYLWDKYLAQIIAGAGLAGETARPVAIVLHRPGMEYDDALVCFRAGDYRKVVERILEVYR